MANESTIRVAMADNMATNPENGNLCQGLSFKQLEVSMSNESGNTCMNPVARIIPAAKALTTTKRFLSGCRAGIERVKSGKQTPIMLVIKIVTIAMILRGNAADLSLQELVSSPHSSSDCERAWGVKMEMMMKKMEMSLTREVSIDHSEQFMGALSNLIFLFLLYLWT